MNTLTLQSLFPKTYTNGRYSNCAVTGYIPIAYYLANRVNISALGLRARFRGPKFGVPGDTLKRNATHVAMYSKL